MRYIEIPPAEMVTNPAGTHEAFTFAKFLEQVVFGHEVWRSDADGTDKHDMLCVLIDKFAGMVPGDVVVLTDAEYEAFRPIATMKGQKLAVGMAGPLNKLMRTTITAPSKAPKPVAVPAAGDKRKARRTGS